MSDYFEIDFLNVGAKDSGDAIPLRYCFGGIERIHVTDGGFRDTGDKIVQHINTYYNNPRRIDAVIVSHPDGDHTGGLAEVLEHFDVSELWMLRPWLYAKSLLFRFPHWSNVNNLRARMKAEYRNIAVLEKIAGAKQIPIFEPFQGERIGHFTVLSPTKKMYLNLVVESDKTPKGTLRGEQPLLAKGVPPSVTQHLRIASSDWGVEIFSRQETSPDNEMSVVQYANLCGEGILLTADAGRAALTEAADYAYSDGLTRPNHFQVPHHGSRRNVSTEILDCWLGPRLPTRPAQGSETFNAIVSASKEDADHPRKAVIRACIHRGGRVVSNENADICVYSDNAPLRLWRPAFNLPYPQDQEQD